MLPDQHTIKAYHVYTYTFLDDLSFIESPYKRFASEKRQRIKDAIELIASRFKEFGWEGDGTIGIIWLPPFVDVGEEDTWGTYIWHVKQRNNGISFVACDVQLTFRRLAAQNEDYSARLHSHAGVPLTIVGTCVKWFTEAIAKTRKEMAESLALLSTTGGDSARSVISNLLSYYQGNLIQCFQEFLDDCYLQVLIEAIESGNPNQIKLRRASVRVDPSCYLPAPEDVGNEDVSSSVPWFTIRGFISDMWRAYKWEPFKSKTEMLFRSLDYTPSEHALFEIRKHVLIRNCMEHHQGHLDRDSLSELGRNKLELLDEKGALTIDVWKPITLPQREVSALINLLVKFATDFDEYVGKRIPTRYFMVKGKTA